MKYQTIFVEEFKEIVRRSYTK